MSNFCIFGIQSVNLLSFQKILFSYIPLTSYVKLLFFIFKCPHFSTKLHWNLFPRKKKPPCCSASLSVFSSYCLSALYIVQPPLHSPFLQRLITDKMALAGKLQFPLQRGGIIASASGITILHLEWLSLVLSLGVSFVLTAAALRHTPPRRGQADIYY